MFKAPSHDLAAFQDQVCVSNLIVDIAEAEGDVLREKGHQRAWDLLKAHASSVEEIAAQLIADRKIDLTARRRLEANGDQHQVEPVECRRPTSDDCAHSVVIDTDQWGDDVRLSDLEQKFVFQACGHVVPMSGRCLSRRAWAQTPRLL
jgi:hypothetical protein